MYLRGPKETVTHNRRIEHGNRENIGKIHEGISVLNFEFNALVRDTYYSIRSGLTSNIYHSILNR